MSHSSPVIAASSSASASRQPKTALGEGLRRLLSLLACLVMALPAQAEVRRRALIVGVGHYDDPNWTDLPYTITDAQAVAQALTQGQEPAWMPDDVVVLTGPQATRTAFLEGARSLLDASEEDDFLLLFFSGHGHVVGRDAYLVFKETRKGIVSTGVEMGDLRRLLEERGLAARKLVVLDACNSGAILGEGGPKGDATGGALTARFMESVKAVPPGVLYLTSSGATEPSWPGSGGMSLFTQHFVDAMKGKAPGDGKYVTFAEVQSYVLDMTKDRQRVHVGSNTSLVTPLTLRRRVGAFVVPPDAEVALWNGVDKTSRAELESYLSSYPTGQFAALARLKLVGFGTPSPVAGLRPAGQNAKGHDVFLRDKDGARVVKVPGGTFQMGSTEEEVKEAIAECRGFWGEKADEKCKPGSYRDQMPQHVVTLGEYLLDELEVTWGRYRKYADATGAAMPAVPAWPQSVRDDSHPVVNVTWDEAAGYCGWVGGALPTEAQWEFAARGPRSLRYPWGSTWPPPRAGANVAKQADYDDGYAKTSPAGALTSGAGPFGHLDLAGNVYEWVQDQHCMYTAAAVTDPKPATCGSDLRVERGGSFNHYSHYSRGAKRDADVASVRSGAAGFRCAQDVP